MACSYGLMDQFSHYALCSPNLWMIIACTCMTLLTMVLMLYVRFGLRRDMRWLTFAQWKLQQLAERLRYQEPNVTLLEQITRKVNEKESTDKNPFDFFRESSDNALLNNNAGSTVCNAKDSSIIMTDMVAAKVKKAKDDDAEKVLRESNIDANTPLVNPSHSEGNSQKILKKWTDATKNILARDIKRDDDKVKRPEGP